MSTEQRVREIAERLHALGQLFHERWRRFAETGTPEAAIRKRELEEFNAERDALTAELVAALATAPRASAVSLPRYEVVSRGDAEALEEIVNGAIAKGAQLLGGVSVSRLPNVHDHSPGSPYADETWAQAIVWPAAEEDR